MILLMIILISFFISFLYTFNDPIIKKKELVKSIVIKKTKKYYYDNRPDFRGLVSNIHMLYKSEVGGSKPFKNIIIDNSNIINNKIDYKLYGSYRIKPFKCNKTK
jgi:hypothetical protein